MAAPPGPPPPVPAPAASRYAGPPSYPVPPRWGFPALGWRRPIPSAAAPARADRTLRVLAATAVPLLAAAGLTALVACAAELWRYDLLLRSRAEALPAGPLAASDALVLTAGLVAPVAAAAAGAVLLRWVLRAAGAAAESAGVRPSRRPWAVLVGWLLPGPNLTVPGSVLAEIEHAALDRPPDAPPRPSRLLRVWWACWASGVVLAVVTVLWGLSDGVQARADGVVLHALTDAVAVATAVLTVAVVRRLTALLQPVDPQRLTRFQVVRVTGLSRTG